jgi:hypothetical protein
MAETLAKALTEATEVYRHQKQQRRQQQNSKQ